MTSFAVSHLHGGWRASLQAVSSGVVLSEPGQVGTPSEVGDKGAAYDPAADADLGLGAVKSHEVALRLLIVADCDGHHDLLSNDAPISLHAKAT